MSGAPTANLAKFRAAVRPDKRFHTRRGSKSVARRVRDAASPRGEERALVSVCQRLTWAKSPRGFSKFYKLLDIDTESHIQVSSRRSKFMVTVDSGLPGGAIALDRHRLSRLTASSYSFILLLQKIKSSFELQFQLSAFGEIEFVAAAGFHQVRGEGPEGRAFRSFLFVFVF